MSTLYFRALAVVLLRGVLVSTIVSEFGNMSQRSNIQGAAVNHSSSQEFGTEVMNNAAQEILSCSGVSIFIYFWSNGNLTDSPQCLSTLTAIHCCQLCQKTEGCEIWTRHRQTEMCCLGYIDGHVARGRLDYSYDSGARNISALASNAPAGLNEPAPCQVETGITYPNGKVILTVSRIGRSRSCCELCRGSSACRSWYWSSTSKTCTLNGDIPTFHYASEEYYSGTA